MKVTYIEDKYDSANSSIKIIDDSKKSLEHPQGPLTIATLNTAGFTPHTETLLTIAGKMAAAEDLYNAVGDCLYLINELMRGIGYIALQDYSIVNEITARAKYAIKKANERGKV